MPGFALPRRMVVCAHAVSATKIDPAIVAAAVALATGIEYRRKNIDYPCVTSLPPILAHFAAGLSRPRQASNRP